MRPDPGQSATAENHRRKIPIARERGNGELGVESIYGALSWPRLVDLVAVAAVAVVVLLPSGSLVAKPALVGDKIELDRVAALEDARFADPTNVDKALALADAYLRADHPEWSLATTASFVDAGDHRVHLARATAYAERLQAAESVAEAARGDRSVRSRGCDEVRRGVARAHRRDGGADAGARRRARSIRTRIPRRRARRSAACCTRPRRTSSSRTMRRPTRSRRRPK